MGSSAVENSSGRVDDDEGKKEFLTGEGEEDAVTVNHAEADDEDAAAIRDRSLQLTDFDNDDVIIGHSHWVPEHSEEETA